MNLSKIIIIVVALVVAIVAMVLSKSFLAPAPPAQVVSENIIEKVETDDVMVAAKNMVMGHKVTANDLQWQAWPKEFILSNMIVRSSNEEKFEQAINSIVKVQIDEGDPIRFTKLVDPKNGGVLSAILAPGMRAISTPISPETGAGGFILPNDRVDVLLTKQDSNSKNKTKTILANIKVLAIDQTITERDGEQVVVGKTATLELSPVQSEILAMGNNEGSLTLSLRSIADRDVGDSNEIRRKKKLTILRHGKS